MAPSEMYRPSWDKNVSYWFCEFPTLESFSSSSSRANVLLATPLLAGRGGGRGGRRGHGRMRTIEWPVAGRWLLA